MIDLDELQRLHEAATPGTWEAREHLVLLPLWNRKYPDGQLRICPSLTYEHQSVEKPNAALIAAARNALPALLRLARRARRLEEAAREAEAILRHQPVPGLSCAASREEPDKLDSDGSCPGCTCELQMALDALRAALAEGEE